MQDYTLYKITRPDGKCSKGGNDADTNESCWTRRGKVWMGMGPLKLHLRQYINHEHFYDENKKFHIKCTNNIPEDWVVITLPIGVDNIDNFSARSLYPETFIER